MLVAGKGSRSGLPRGRSQTQHKQHKLAGLFRLAFDLSLGLLGRDPHSPLVVHVFGRWPRASHRPSRMGYLQACRPHCRRSTKWLLWTLGIGFVSEISAWAGGTSSSPKCFGRVSGLALTLAPVARPHFVRSSWCHVDEARIPGATHGIE